MIIIVVHSALNLVTALKDSCVMMISVLLAAVPMEIVLQVRVATTISVKIHVLLIRVAPTHVAEFPIIGHFVSARMVIMETQKSAVKNMSVEQTRNVIVTKNV